MAAPGRISTLRSRSTVLGAAMLVCGLVLAVLGFSGTGPFLGVMGLVVSLCGSVAIAVGLAREGSR